MALYGTEKMEIEQFGTHNILICFHFLLKFDCFYSEFRLNVNIY